jgi:formylglycine-generating enzyme required for sulfatase activity
METDTRRGSLVLAAWAWLALALLAVPFANAVERGVVLVYDAQGEQAKSATARTALVIGNGSYRGAPLKNPVNDATDVAQALRGLGFEVVLSLDVDKRVLVKAMRKFQKRLQRRGGVGLFYYAGHGIQVRGSNYLIPVGADIETEADVEYAAVNAGLVLRYMEEADAQLNIVILDACRDNPYGRSWRSASRGLVRLKLPQGPLGSLLAYSTAPGEVAADGTGRNSPFTKHLLLSLGIADLDLEDVFKKTRIGVKRDTDGKQIPWSESSLVGDFYFQRSTLTGAKQAVAVPRPPKLTPQKAQLTVRSNLRGDTVYIDGQEMGSTRLDVELAPGRHSVRVEKKGYVPYEETVELETGRNPVMRATLSKAPVIVERAEPVTPKHPSVEFTSVEPVTSMEFVWIPPDCFEMGNPAGRKDARQHRVCVEGFWLGKHEVTNAQYRRFRSDHDSGEDEGHSLNGEDHPVVEVDWHAATAFAEWLSQKTGEHFRLPTEAEWEYAARAGTKTATYWGDYGTDKACAYANFADKTMVDTLRTKKYPAWSSIDVCEDGYAVSAPVGQFSPNAFGLYDMLGNVKEWTCSLYDKDYGGAEKDCASKDSSDRRVTRGGSWNYFPLYVHSANRDWDTPDSRLNNIGFRLARTP